MSCESIIGIILSSLTLLLSFIAITISLYLGKKSNKIALYSQKIEVYNVINNAFKKLKILKINKNLLTITPNNPLNSLINSKEYKVWLGISTILNNNNNYLLFMEQTSNEIEYIKNNIKLINISNVLFWDNFIKLYESFYKNFTDNLLGKIQDTELQNIAQELGEFCDSTENKQYLYGILHEIQKPLV